MSHVRQQLREGVRNVLLGQTNAFNSVFVSREYPISQEELPTLIITTESERVDNFTVNHPIQQLRTIDLNVTVINESVNGVENLSDSICSDVEKLISESSTIANSITLSSTTGMQPNVVGDKPVMIVEMNFTAQISTLSNNPDVAV